MFEARNKSLYHRTVDWMVDRVFCHRVRSFAKAYQSKKSDSSPMRPASNFFKNAEVVR